MDVIGVSKMLIGTKRTKKQSLRERESVCNQSSSLIELVMVYHKKEKD